MANDITVTKNTTSGSERWDVEYTADSSGTVTKTMDTAETILDRDIKVTVTIPSGSAATPATTITSNPTISVNSSTGVITASNSKTQDVTPTVSAGYVTGGTSGTITVSGSNTSNLTTQAAQTIYPSTSDQTIASGKYLTGTQTIKAVTTTNLSAGNIKSGVTVKVGDSADDDRVASVTGSYSGIDVSDTTAAASDVRTGKYFYTAAGTKTQGSLANGSATTPATTVTANPTISVNSSTGVITATASATKSVTPTVSAGYVSSGTAGTITVSGSNTSNLTTKGATTYTPTTTDQTIASGTYLTGTQTIVGDANLVAGNIKKDVAIFGVTGTYEGSGGGGGGGILPSGYTQVDCILSDGTATNQVETSSRVYSQTFFKYQLTTTASADEAIFGCGFYNLYRSSGGNNQIRNNGGQSASLGSTSGWHVGTACRNGAVLSNDTSSASADCTMATITSGGTNTTMYIFSNNGSDYAKGRIALFKQWDGSNLLHDLIPCLRDSDDAAGFYDVVTDAFYTASGYLAERLFSLDNYIDRAAAWGSTWGDWVNSSYNTEGWTVGSTGIERASGRWTYAIQDRTGGTYVYPQSTDLIKNIHYTQVRL